MKMNSQITRRFYHLREGAYYNEDNERFLPKTSKRLHKTVVLNPEGTQILSSSELKNFRQLCSLEKKCQLKVGQENYEKAYTYLPEGELLCQMHLLHSKTGTISPDLNHPELLKILALANTETAKGPVELQFKYCSRGSEGVVPLQELVEYKLVRLKNCYKITLPGHLEDIASEKQNISQKCLKKGFFEWIK